MYLSTKAAPSLRVVEAPSLRVVEVEVEVVEVEVEVVEVVVQTVRLMARLRREGVNRHCSPGQCTRTAF